MDTNDKSMNEAFVHDFIEVISEKAEEIKCNLSSFGKFKEDNPLDFIQKIIFPDADMRGFNESFSKGKVPPCNPSGFDYTANLSQQYCYGFTNSEFLAFIAGLSPVEYLIVISLIAVIITEPLNLRETVVTYTLMNSIATVMDVLESQESFQAAVSGAATTRQQQIAIQQDFDFLMGQVQCMQQQIKSLESQLQQCITPHKPKPY